MKTHSLLVSLCTIFLGFTGLAQAGECTAKIDQLQQLLSKSDAGMGATGNPSAAQSDASQSGNAVGTPITQGTSNALEGKAASPSDVQQQNQGQPTASDTQSGKVPLNTSAAHAHLDRAKQFDKTGREAECLDEITKAKGAFGAQ